MGPPSPERLTISLGRFKSEKPEFTINALNDIIKFCINDKTNEMPQECRQQTSTGPLEVTI